jgi:UDP-N-acetylglucosamine 1-carboxyvinyltransferase
MAQFIITGGKKLKGTVEIGGAKNSVLKILPAAILCDGPVTVEHIPLIEDMRRMVELLKFLGSTVEEAGLKSLRVDATSITSSTIHEDIAKRLRSSIVLTGPLLARFGKVKFPHPGGCVIGKRPIDLFLDGFRALGAAVYEELLNNYPMYVIEGKRLRGAEYIFKNISVTGTECLMMAATRIKGMTILRNCAMEPEIPALATFLNSCGARIKGAGTHTIEIEGVETLTGGTFTVLPDRIDAGSFAILAAATGSEITIASCVPEHSSTVLQTLRGMGVGIDVHQNSVVIHPARKLFPHAIKTHEYPGFPTDLQAPFTVLATQAEGESLVHETVYEGRLFYTESLNRMGAKIHMFDPHRILVHGATELHGHTLESPDLRAGLAFVIAALVAKGITTIGDIYSIERGYEDIEGRLRALGADIKHLA